MRLNFSNAPIDMGGVALGKFAGNPEFLRTAGAGEAVDSLDAWLDEGTQVAFERWGPEWKTSFLMGAAYGFLWKARRDEAHLCGILAPSRDAVGRDYPLAIASRFDPGLIARAPHLAPLAFGNLLEAAYRLVDEARSFPLAQVDFDARVRGMAAVTPNEVVQAEAEYLAWSRATRLEEGWSAVFLGDRPLDQAAAALDAVGMALAPVREQRGGESTVVLRLPLGTGGVGAAALWLDVVGRLCGRPATVPSAFWAVDSQVLLLPIGEVSPRAFSELWRPSPADGFTCEKPDAAPWSSRSGGLAPGRILRGTDRGSLMSTFLDALAR